MKIICVGRNYTDHIKELDNKKPKDPVLFLKPQTAIINKGQPFFIPSFSNEIHYELEVIIKINRLGRFIEKKFSHKYYDEIGLGIDFTARDLQLELKNNGLPWEKAKAFDGSCLIGDWKNKKDFNNIDNIDFRLTKNDEIVQNSNTSLMLWKIDELIEYISKFFTLKIGDVIFTGTPSGVGKVQLNDKLKGYMNDDELLSINIK
ncbi:MAG: 2-hydroxyhepta-2,4-diene-1,7-dioate isomerase [Flavobacteriaceae bacterium]|jgi:2-keto-4-pentenoate hydratase/2-oxohepta-3-ene-1,7-dioic acid hydratase in catechol pathway|nr:2-hydroxyhepta-2,4-diene-1,7-dioate isomerase [Flavobacteriaceae bacterium]|tara:strand:- start:1367 stop:1978 length:612 start_codon:yes stop_codon:yes gene_type:complete